jgi:pyruvate formate lyase activating enzyme
MFDFVEVIDMKEAILYQRMENNKVRCAVCCHRCTISEGKRGICRVRENQGGTLYSLNYGKTIARNIDPMEKKPLYHFMPGTWTYSFAAQGCNFHCQWCQNWEISQRPAPGGPVKGIDITPEEHVAKAIEAGCPSISYTYSEPTVFVEYALDTMKLAKEKGLKNIWHSNGYMTIETLDMIAPYLDAANIDFKGPDDDVYIKYCGGKAQHVMETLVYLHKAGIHEEITTLIIPDVNDRPEQMQKIAHFIASEVGREVPWHITRFFPGWKMLDTQVTPLESLEKAQMIGNE